jgi:hypothetical protein
MHILANVQRGQCPFAQAHTGKKHICKYFEQGNCKFGSRFVDSGTRRKQKLEIFNKFKQ